MVQIHYVDVKFVLVSTVLIANNKTQHELV